MKWESTFFTVFLIILVASLFSLKVQRVEASGTVHIRADGSIDPPTAPIETLDNVTYKLTGDISTSSDGIILERNDIAIDGGKHSVKGSGEGNGIDLTERSGVTVGNTSVNNFYYGICLSNTQETTLSRNDIANNGHGIHLDFSSDNFVNGNNIRANNFSGVYLYFSDNNSVCGNNVVESPLYGGIYLYSSANNNVNGNNVSANNGSGIGLEDGCSNNTISENNITNNGGSIILYYSSSNNKFYHNNIINNIHKVYLNSSATSIWDDGYPSGGNYWSDYNGVDADHDGIGDTPYMIDTNNTDHYPLMTQYVIPEFPTFLILPIFFTATLLAVTIYKRKQKPVR